MNTYLFVTLKHIIWHMSQRNNFSQVFFFFLICLFQLTRPLATTPVSGAVAQAPPPGAAGAAPNQSQAVMSQEELMMSMAANLASITSRTSMSMVIVGGVVGNTLIQQCVKSSDLRKCLEICLLFFFSFLKCYSCTLLILFAAYLTTLEFSAFLSLLWYKRKKTFQSVVWCRKIIHVRVVTVTLHHAMPDYPVVGYFPITTCPVMFIPCSLPLV